jgi:hypothetical protein
LVPVGLIYQYGPHWLAWASLPPLVLSWQFYSIHCLGRQVRRAAATFNQALSLLDNYRKTGRLDELSAAIELFRGVAAALPADDSNYAVGAELAIHQGSGKVIDGWA